MSWRLLDEPAPAPGAWNMAVDEALYEALESGASDRPVLRLYTWSPACLSFGFHQEFDAVCDADYIASRGFSAVRRPTGGKAVLHDAELTYSVVALHAAPFGGGLLETYARIAAALAASLARLGLPVTVKERALAIAPGSAAPCFLVPSEKEILVDGRKVVGSAQKRGPRAFLQHGSVPVHLDYEALARATRNSAADATLYRRTFSGLGNLRPGLEVEELRRAFRLGFPEVFAGTWEETGLTKAEADAAARLHREKYATDRWNRGRMPC